MFDTPFIIPVVAIVAWAVISIFRIRHGYPDQDWDSSGKNARNPPLFRKMFDKAIEERDAEIAKLRERIEVLEKIVIETHKSSRLSDEIDRLRDQHS